MRLCVCVWCVCFLSQVPQLGRSFVPERGRPAGWAPANSGFRTRDVTSTKCTIFPVFTETQQSFKFQVSSKRRRKENKKKTNQQKEPTQTDVTTKELPAWGGKNTKKREKTEVTTQLHRSQDNR